MFGCTSRDTIVDKSKLLGADYRLFQDTPAWELAKAVQDGDTDKIKAEVNKNKKLLSFRKERWGSPLLKLAVYHTNYASVKTLLELGADPNMQDFNYGDSPLMMAAKIWVPTVGPDPIFLKILLKYGGDPNAIQQGPKKTKNTVLEIACEQGSLNYVKLLVDAGAKVNYVGEYDDSALAIAAMLEHIDIVVYLIEKGADYKRILYKTVPEKENRYLTDAMREWRFDLGSDEYKKKMKLVEFLKKNGMDYRKTPIPEEFKSDYSKEYLDKY